MDFGFTDEQELFRKTVRQFSEREVRPQYADRERPDYDLPAFLQRMAELGLLGLRAPVEYGGVNTSYVNVGIATEELSRSDYNVGTLIVSSVISTEVLSLHATDRVKEEWLADMVSGRRHVALALTEPHSGSDAAALTTRAVRDGDHYVITGEKSSTSQVDADACIVFVRTGQGTGARDVSAILVPLDTPGVGTSRFTDLGMKLSRRGALHLDGVRVPAHNLVGREGQGFYTVMNQFDYTRAVIAIQCVATAMQSVEETIEYVKTRTAFGQPIARYEGVSFPIAEALATLEAARLLCYKALWLRDVKLPHAKEAAMAKWLGPKLAVEAIHQMLLLHGHAGYSSDYPHGQRLRDVIGHQIGDGTGEIMKLIIARETLGREFRPR
ncbi:MAG: acyl-CoA dehydrogenase family protein [Candidatus Rokubacteria bacterium]|nr:acyl-CoA dehydrogenase family protein [Candidatus Rokubacteria bacterium]